MLSQPVLCRSDHNAETNDLCQLPMPIVDSYDQRLQYGVSCRWMQSQALLRGRDHDDATNHHPHNLQDVQLPNALGEGALGHACHLGLSRRWVSPQPLLR